MSEEDFAYNTCMRIDPRIKCHNVLRRLRDLGRMFRLFTPFFNIAFSINDFIWSIAVATVVVIAHFSGAYYYSIILQPEKRCRAVGRSENPGRERVVMWWA